MAIPAPNGPSGFMVQETFVHRGPLYTQAFDTDGSLWLPACGGAGGIFTFVGTFTSARNASGDYSLNLTAAGNSPFVVVDLSQVFDKIGSDPIGLLPGVLPSGQTAVPGNLSAYPMPAGMPAGSISRSTPGAYKVGTRVEKTELHLIRGIQLIGYDLIYSIGTANLTTFTGTCLQTTYSAAGAAGVVVTTDAAQNLPKNTSANLQVGSITIATPYIIGNNASVAGSSVVADYLEIAIVNPGTSVLKIYGIRLYFNYCLH